MTSISVRGPFAIADITEQRNPLDIRYGPYDYLEDAMEELYGNGSTIKDKTYYGLTIGVYKFDDGDEDNIIGLDEYWWQPRCVWDSTKSDYV